MQALKRRSRCGGRATKARSVRLFCQGFVPASREGDDLAGDPHMDVRFRGGVTGHVPSPSAALEDMNVCRLSWATQMGAFSAMLVGPRFDHPLGELASARSADDPVRRFSGSCAVGLLAGLPRDAGGAVGDDRHMLWNFRRPNNCAQLAN